MSDAPKRYAQFLDQLLPFLDAAPVWFKIWIFVLIILIFATTGMAGVFYLISRGQQIARQSLQSFAVERPREGDQLPLGQSRSWLLEGQFPMLQNFRAYMLKNYAMIMRDRGRGDEFERALAESARMFAAIRQQNLSDASAWNGLGSVELLRGNPEKALIYINRALELVPNYPAALNDRRVAQEMIKAEDKPKQ